MGSRLKSDSYASVKVPGYVLCKQNIQKQSPKVFHKKGTANHFVKLTGKHLFGNFFFNEITGMRSTTLLKRDCYTVYEIVKNTLFGTDLAAASKRFIK